MFELLEDIRNIPGEITFPALRAGKVISPDDFGMPSGQEL